MLNKYPIWKYLIILFVVGFGLLYAAPNIYPPDAAVQIKPLSSKTLVDQRVLDRATAALRQANIEYFGESVDEKGAIVRIKDKAQQLSAKEVIAGQLGDAYIIALNMAPTTPDWLVSFGAQPMTLGLDLSGGVHFLMEVDMKGYLKQKRADYVQTFKRQFREEKLRYKSFEWQTDTKLIIAFDREDFRDNAKSLLRKDYLDFNYKTDDEDGLYTIEMNLLPDRIKQIEDYAIQQNLVALRNRVNELGVAEPLVQRQGKNRIVVQLPGVQDTAQAKKILGKTANLEFRLEARPDEKSWKKEKFEFKSGGRPSAFLEKELIITGQNVSHAAVGYDENGLPQVNITLDSYGGTRMHKVTRHAVKRAMGVLFVETNTKVSKVVVDGKEEIRTRATKTKEIISLATIQSALGNSFRITGLELGEASELSLLLRAGALAAPMYFVEERTVGPTLGQENIEMGTNSVVLGFCLVLVFMVIFYRVFGLFANVALTVNLLLIVAVMSLMGATLTLPGIAGIVLTVGMAVDANVLVFSRIREELKSGLPPQQAMHAGYERAFLTIFDANITTLIVAVILYAIGTGPVKGFAVTLMIGITTSMFTAIMLTRGLANAVYGGRSISKLSI